MSQKHYPSPELRETSRLLLKAAPHNNEPVKELDQLRLSRDLVLVDSTAGAENVKLPLASESQGDWVAIVKISADGNNVNAVTKGSDKVNKIGTWNATSVLVGAAQGSHAIFGNDGVSKWYQIA